MAKRHPHKYHRVDLNYAKVFACALPDCPHYMPKHMEETLPGKAAICWGCDKKFILDPQALEMNKPECIPCRTGVRDIVEETPVTEDNPLAKYLKDLNV